MVTKFRMDTGSKVRERSRSESASTAHFQQGARGGIGRGHPGSRPRARTPPGRKCPPGKQSLLDKSARRQFTPRKMGVHPPTVIHAEAERELRAVYAELEKRPLARDCTLRTGCCHFRRTGMTPLVTRAEALFAAKGVRASGRVSVKPHPDGACPLLGADGRCTIYEHRPFGCRTHFCAEAGGPSPRRHVADLIHRLEALDEKLGHHDAARPFVAALSDALAVSSKRRR